MTRVDWKPLKSFWFDWSFSQAQCPTVRWTVKMKVESLKTLGMNSKTRVGEKGLVECLRRKYQQIEVYSRR